MASKGEFITLLRRLDYQVSEPDRCAVGEQAGRVWAALSDTQRSQLLHDDHRARIFATGYSAGHTRGLQVAVDVYEKETGRGR